MGTINYRTSNYITMGINPPSACDLENDADFMEELREGYNLAEDEDTAEAINDYIYMIMDDDRANLETIRNKYNFYYFHIVIKSGYYEGFYLDIENNLSVCFDDYTEKQEAQKEITQIKAFLTECAGIGLVSVWPGWCTTYHDYKTTLTHINEAIKEMRDEVRSTPTWKQFKKEA